VFLLPLIDRQILVRDNAGISRVLSELGVLLVLRDELLNGREEVDGVQLIWLVTTERVSHD
jgi:hypothetical protein